MDKKIVCKECRKEFIFTDSEQNYFKKKNFTEPKRCPDCRKEKKKNENEDKGDRKNQKFERKFNPKQNFPKSGKGSNWEK